MMGDVQVVALAEQDVPVEFARQVAELQDAAWPDAQPAAAAGRPLAAGPRWPRHDPELHPELLLLTDGELVVASLALLHAQLRHAGVTFAAAGLSAVTTRRQLRGRGYGHRLVVAARERLAGSAVDLGVFTCDEPLEGFYERAGWERLPGTVLLGGTREAPFRSDQPGFAKATMARFFSPAARARRADFVNSELALYPGDIDRLW